MNKVKNCFKLRKNIYSFINTNITNYRFHLRKPILFCNAKYFSSESYNTTNDNFSNKKIKKENILDNINKLRRHEKKSNLNVDQYNRIKINPNDETFYGKFL